MSERIGVVGLGNIGGRVARVLLEEYSVTVFDIDEDRRANLVDAGATAVDSGRSVGETTDVVICSLPDDEALRAAVLGDDGVLAGCSGGEVIRHEHRLTDGVPVGWRCLSRTVR